MRIVRPCRVLTLAAGGPQSSPSAARGRTLESARSRTTESPPSRAGGAPMKIALVMSALTAIACVGAWAQAGNTYPQREFAINGVGTTSCTKYVAASPTELSTITAWVQGFLSGANSYRYISHRRELLLLPEAKEVSAWLSTFCKGVGADNVYQASIGLWKSIEDQTTASGLQECRAAAARDAKTETGARALLADCAAKFPAVVQPVSELGEQECLAKGMVYEPGRFVGSKCQEPYQVPTCTPHDLAENARARLSKSACTARGDSWSSATRLCNPRGGGPAFVVECKVP